MKSCYLRFLAEEQLCTVHEVRVDPCREAEERKPCSLKKGRNATIYFEFTPRTYTQSIMPQSYILMI